MDTLNQQLAEAMGQETAPEETPEVEQNGEILEETEGLAAEGESQEEAEIRTLREYAEAYEEDPESLYSLSVEMPDNEEGVPLGELKDRYMQTRTQAEQQQQALQQQAEQMAAMQQQLMQAQQQDQVLENAKAQMVAISQQYQATNWADLEKEDPARAALMRQKFNDAYNGAQGQLQQMMGQVQQRNEATKQQRLQQGQQYLAQKIPEWRNPETARGERQEIARMLQSEGLPGAAISQIGMGMYDPVFVKLGRELIQLRKMVSAGKDGAKRVTQSPKRSLRGGRIGSTRSKNTAKLEQRARSTRSKRDQLDAVKALLSG